MTTELDPLSTPCDDIDISYPLLPASNYEMTIKEATLVLNKKETGNNLVTKFANAKEAQSTKGDNIAIGQVVITMYTGLVTTEKYSSKDIAKNITRIVKAAKMTGVTPADIIANPSQLAGKVVLAKVGIRAETQEFAEANEIKSFVIEG